MSGLGSVTLSSLSEESYDSFSFDEGMCGLLFDYGLRADAFSEYPIAAMNFGDNQVVVINNIDDAVNYGITENGVMNGIPYYHIKQYYDYIGVDHKLYVSFASCVAHLNGVMTPDFSQIQFMQQSAKGEIYQIGIWTEQQIWTNVDGQYGFTQLLGEIQAQCNILGAVGLSGNSASPLSVLLNCCTSALHGDTNARKRVDFKKLPNCLGLDFPKITIILGQNGTDEVHQMQSNNVNYTPVGMIGIALACCTTVPAEESVGAILYCDLNKDDNFQHPELGFGDLSNDISENQYNGIDVVNQIRRNIISSSGYVLPTTYKAKEASVYLSNDQTLSEGDYKSLSNNRVIHKIRRVIKSVMLPYVEGNIEIDPLTGCIAVYDAALITNDLNDAIDSILINKNGQQQVGGRIIEVDLENNILQTDSLKVDVRLVALESSDVINFEETYQLEQ